MHLNNALCIQDAVYHWYLVNTELSVFRKGGVYVMANARSGSMKIGWDLLL